MPRLSLWRVTGEDNAYKAFTGKGAADSGGRWNKKGTPVVYAADSLAAATLEFLAYVQSPSALNTRIYFRVEVDEDAVLELARDALPSDWNALPYPRSTQRLGSGWVAEMASVGLRVPSVLVPETYNVVLNPLHPDFGQAVSYEGPFPLKLDKRIASLVKLAFEGGEPGISD